MITKVNQVSLDDLEKINPSDITAVLIENKISDPKLDLLRNLIRRNDEIKITLVVDPAVVKIDGESANLEIVKKLGNVKYVSLLCFASEALESLKELEGIDTLVSFKISGQYNKKIDLAPLRQSTGIQDFELEYGLAHKNQTLFINQQANLQKLKISTVDSASLEQNTNLVELEITNTLKHADVLSSVFPSMRKFSFSHAKGMQSFDFISTFKSLEELSVGYTTKLVKLPQVANPKKIKSLTLINTPKFNDMEGILQYENLENFVMNEHTVIPIEEITKLEKLKKLKKVYLNFKKESDHRLFEELVHRNGWINNNL